MLHAMRPFSEHPSVQTGTYPALARRLQRCVNPFLLSVISALSVQWWDVGRLHSVCKHGRPFRKVERRLDACIPSDHNHNPVREVIHVELRPRLGNVLLRQAHGVDIC